MPTKTEPTVEARVEYLKTIKSWDGEPVYEFRALYEEPPATAPQEPRQGEWIRHEDALAKVAAERERWRALLTDVSKQTRHPDYDWPVCLQREVNEALKA